MTVVADAALEVAAQQPMIQLTCVEGLSYPPSRDVFYDHWSDKGWLMDPAAEIESIARSYLDGERTLSELEEWLAPNLPILFQFPEHASVSRLAARIELAIAEMDAEALDEDHVRDSIRELLPLDPLVLVLVPTILDTAASSNLVEEERLPEPPEIRLGFQESPVSSSAVTVVQPGVPSYTSA
jgi:hypothetical protein